MAEIVTNTYKTLSIIAISPLCEKAYFIRNNPVLCEKQRNYKNNIIHIKTIEFQKNRKHRFLQHAQEPICGNW